MKRVLIALAILALVLGFRLLLLELGSAQARAQDTDPEHAPIHYIGDPVEVVLHDTNGMGVEPVYLQCDGHGHRVYASRHPIRFVVITDPTCQGGPTP